MREENDLIADEDEFEKMIMLQEEDDPEFR